MWSHVDASPADAMQQYDTAVDNVQLSPEIYLSNNAPTSTFHIFFVVKVGLVDISKYDLLALR